MSPAAAGRGASCAKGGGRSAHYLRCSSVVVAVVVCCGSSSGSGIIFIHGDAPVWRIFIMHAYARAQLLLFSVIGIWLGSESDDVRAGNRALIFFHTSH